MKYFSKGYYIYVSFIRNDGEQLLDTKISNTSYKHEFADTFDELQDNAVQF